MTNNDKELNDFIDLLYSNFVKRLKQENFIKTTAQMKNAQVISVTNVAVGDTGAVTNIGQNIEVRLPYDADTFIVKNKTGEELSVGDTVQLMYWIDLKNAVAIFKV